MVVPCDSLWNLALLKNWKLHHFFYSTLMVVCLQKGCHSVLAQGAVHGHSSGTEFRPLIHHTEALNGLLPASKRQRREFVQSEISQASFARIGSVVGQGTSDQKTDLGCADRPKKEEIHLEPELDIFKADSSPFLLSEGGHLESQSNRDHQQSLRHPETCAQSVPAHRMRLYKNLNQSTTGEAIGPDYTFYEIDEENLESQNRVGFSALDDVSEPLPRCPVCNDLVPSQVWYMLCSLWWRSTSMKLQVQ